MSDTPIQRGHEEIERVCEELELDDDVADVARAILVRAGDEGLLSGRPIEITAGAAVVISCRQTGLPFSSRDVTKVSAASEPDDDTDSPSLLTQIERARRKLESSLHIETGVIRPASYIDRFVGELGLSERTEEVARELLSRAVRSDRESLSGKSPSGVAGGAIYLATLLCDERRTQYEIAQVAASEIAIRANYHTLLEIFGRNDIHFDADDLDTDRFDREVEKVMSGNEYAAEAEQNKETSQEDPKPLA